MNLYVTLEDKFKLKKSFLNLRKQQLIIVNEIISELGYIENQIDEYSSFIVNQRIKKIIYSTSLGRKMQSVIYTNPNLNEEIIRDLINYCQNETSIDKVVFLTEKYQNEEYYELFDEILFFPSIKKVQIIECKSFPLEWIEDSFN